MKIIRTSLLVTLLMLGSVAKAQLGYQNFRHIHINGNHLSDEQIQELDQTLGYGVPNGFYWLNQETGEWGYQGSDEVLGTIYINNGQTGYSPQPNSGSSRPTISNDTGTGNAVINPEGCSYVTSGGMTFRSC